MRHLATIAVLLVAAAGARAQVGGGYDLTWSTIDCGGGTSTAGMLTMIQTIGQPEAETMSGGNYQLSGGFLGGPSGPPPCYPDCNLSGNLTVADFGCFQGKYVLGDLYADCNASGNLTVADFGCFQGKYVLGCP